MKNAVHKGAGGHVQQRSTPRNGNGTSNSNRGTACPKATGAKSTATPAGVTQPSTAKAAKKGKTSQQANAPASTTKDQRSSKRKRNYAESDDDVQDAQQPMCKCVVFEQSQHEDDDESDYAEDNEPEAAELELEDLNANFDRKQCVPRAGKARVANHGTLNVTPGRTARASATHGQRFPSPVSANKDDTPPASSEDDGDGDGKGVDGFVRDEQSENLQSEDDDQMPNPVTPARHTIPPFDYTPYSPCYNEKDPSKHCWGDQSPDTNMVVNLGSQLYVSDVMVTNPYPNEPTRVQLSSAQLLCAADLLGLSCCHAHLTGDNQYMRDCLKMIKGRDLTTRSQVVSTAQSLAGPLFRLPTLQSPPEIKRQVSIPLKKDAYVFKNLVWDNTSQVIQRIGAYQNSLIEEIIFMVFFVGGNKLAIAEHTRDLFKPIPISTIEFTGTAIECALHDWSAGVQTKASSPFSADTWSVTYAHHLRALKKLNATKSDMLDALQLCLWNSCWSMTDAALADIDDDDEDAIALTTNEIDGFELA